MSKERSTNPEEVARLEAAVAAGKILAAQARERRANKAAWFVESKKGNLQAIKELLAAGVDVDAVDMTVEPRERATSTGLARAIRAGSVECAQEMLAAGPSREHLAMARVVAVRADAAEIFKALARHEFPGAIGLPMARALSINAELALSIDAPNCFSAIVDVLRGANSTLSARLSENNWLHEAALAAAPKCLGKMLALFDSNLPNKNQRTALMLAAGLDFRRAKTNQRAERQIACIQVLLPSTNLDAKDLQGKTALEWAREAGGLEAAALIEAAEIGRAEVFDGPRAARPAARL